MKKFTIKTPAEGMLNITDMVQSYIEESNVSEGICVVHCVHTTAGITINENADPDVVTDILYGLGKVFPDHSKFRHMEGNSSAHLKASFMGNSATIPISSNRLVLGTWQGIYFCEFDGPRTRNFYVTVK